MATKTDKNKLSSFIDHTLLKPNATKKEIVKLCKEAIKYGFASICVNPIWVPLCAKLLKGTNVKVSTVVGFPLGATKSEVKTYEAMEAKKDGAQEIDMVINIGELKSGNYKFVEYEIKNVIRSVGKNVIVKVILETGYLTKREKIITCRLAKKVGAHFVKTSTGFGPSGATVSDVKLLRKIVGNRIGVKAAGGIGDRATAIKMIKAGATRIGSSSGVKLIS